MNLFKLLSGLGRPIIYLQRKGGAAGLPRHPHWDGDTRILIHSPAHKVTCQAEYELRSHGPHHTRRSLHGQRSLETPSWIFIPRPGIHGNHLAAWGSASIEAFLGLCASSEGPCPRSSSKSTAFAMTYLGSPDAYVYTRPVARVFLEGGGFWRPPNFQKFRNLVAVIHSLLQLSLIVQRKQW